MLCNAAGEGCSRASDPVPVPRLASVRWKRRSSEMKLCIWVKPQGKGAEGKRDELLVPLSAHKGNPACIHES